MYRKKIGEIVKNGRYIPYTGRSKRIRIALIKLQAKYKCKKNSIRGHHDILARESVINKNNTKGEILSRICAFFYRRRRLRETISMSRMQD